jgi:hypothetical protein
MCDHVYVVSEGTRWEGCEVIGVCATQAGAYAVIAAAILKAQGEDAYHANAIYRWAKDYAGRNYVVALWSDITTFKEIWEGTWDWGHYYQMEKVAVRP